MAELEAPETPANDCCSPSAQETCCEPEGKSECCGDGRGDGCGCSAGGSTDADDIPEVVRKRYAAGVTKHR